MTVLHSFCIAFAMYSKLPMPTIKWSENNIRYALCFFPFVGILTGGFCFAWWYLCSLLQIHSFLYPAGMAAIPILITGGIHLDGYMDTMDALHSYRGREEKLRILKDPHIGAFSVITLLIYYLLDLGCLSEITDRNTALLFACCFILSRILSAMSCVWFPNAKKEGSLYSFSEGASQDEKVLLHVRLILLLEFTLVCGLLLFLHLPIGILIIIVSLSVYCFYYYKAIKEFGGITGDLAGWFLCLCELFCVLFIVIGEGFF